ncbi:flagellar hook-length control protein FliK [Sphingomonas sp. HF-S4]|uniref:Flagellar hook-length control protein FliK n=1 Tax=Sphingomonas agrestis TaxID=3080540 RepID=A0ABU3Y7M5_9SPHN|nr:flagellar hook-length control protein FliK [Sphingomonas sp. HF-S4]MDV3457405.1 flagellar hook-length control protein FliK [Sphingomonas sp. HF-S4]
MQINPFGFPLGAGTQPASALAAGGLGFIDALGVAIDGSAPAITGLTGSTTMPAHFDAKLSQTLLANAQLDSQPMPATPPLPGLQQPTSLSQLMATAAKLPAAEPPPVAGQAPGADLAAPLAQPMVAQPEITQPEDAQPEAAKPEMAPRAPAAVAPEPVATQPVVAPPVQAPAKTPVETAVAEVEAQPETPALEAGAAKPQKRVRAATAEAEPAQPEAKPAPAPAPVPAAAVVPQAVAAQPQPVARDAAAPQTPGTTVKKTGAAPAAFEGAPQAATGAGTTDFADAVAAQGGKPGADANADGQPQPEFVPGTLGKADAPAPVAAPAAHHSASVDATRAAAPAAPAPAPHAEHVIDAHRHLGQSLGVEIAKKVELGEETLRIRLNPIELGRIEVTLAFDDKGALQATVRTDSAQAMDLLRQDAGDLARTLDQAGVRTDAQSFRFENRGGSDGNGQQAQHQHSQNRGPFAASDDDALVAEPIYRPVRSDGQVDLLA